MMADTAIDTIERLEALAAWHRGNADHAGSLWVWEARLRTAEDLERQAAALRGRLSSWIDKPDPSTRRPKRAFDDGPLPCVTQHGYNDGAGVSS
jgi:hypothetical protein